MNTIYKPDENIDFPTNDELLNMFAHAMNFKLRATGKGQGWKEDVSMDLVKKLDDRVERYMNGGSTKDLIDIANYAFLIWIKETTL